MSGHLLDRIVNPETGRKVSIYSEKGQHILCNYLDTSHRRKSQSGGGFFSSRKRVKPIHTITGSNVRNIIQNYPRVGQWNPDIVHQLDKVGSKLYEQDYQVLYNKAWNTIDDMMKVQNTKCQPSGKQQKFFRPQSCWNSYVPLKGSVLSRISRRDHKSGSVIGNPGQSAVTDYCSYLMKNLAEREMGSSGANKIPYSRSASKSQNKTQNYLGMNSECSTLCSSLQNVKDEEVKDIAIKVVNLLASNPDGTEWKKYESHPKWPQVKAVLEDCSQKCPINLLNRTCGFIIKNQGLKNGLPLDDLCTFSIQSPKINKACKVNNDILLTKVNKLRNKLCKQDPTNPGCIGSRAQEEGVPPPSQVSA